ncbi:T9SS type A sorting domain-containing protein [Hymenobacter pini]|uniref:T9SS type A sorting domain-containing protein n=1 Tax=Hymenobacter pini TaxID=2880879 RepID=UPI001CF2045E|nr:T9SS type A sorting domain-containing protein [Hymenobacter pini]MCA8830482.1 T9SS type A sorting domain-containing protein [Hymenobacter pini]
MAKLSTAGTWTQSFAVLGTNSIVPTAMVADTNGDLLITGLFYGTARFMEPPLSNVNAPYGTSTTADVFVARYSKSEGWNMAVRGGGRGHESASSIALDAQGNILIAGTFQGATTTFGAFTLTNSMAPAGTDLSGSADIYVARLSRAGQWTQVLAAGGQGSDTNSSILTDPTGAVVIVGGDFAPPASFGSLILTSASSVSGVGYVARVGGLPLRSSGQQATASVRLAPNPTQRYTTLTLPAAATTQRIEVLDALGRLVRTQTVPALETSTQLDVLGLKVGVYFVRSGSSTARLLVE